MTISFARHLLWGSMALAALFTCQSPVWAQTLSEKLADAPPIIRVEEDWEALVGEPEPEANLPQIVVVFGPTNANFGTHTVFELNHGTQPQFAAGGMQLQVWWGDFLIGYQSQFSPTELAFAGEQVSFTTVTRLDDHRLVMSIIDGTSQTWGNFGGSEFLRVSVLTTRDDLNPYDPTQSVKQSRVTFGANRVTYFRRNAIRFYSVDGLYLEDTTPEYVHCLAVPPQGGE